MLFLVKVKKFAKISEEIFVKITTVGFSGKIFLEIKNPE